MYPPIFAVALAAATALAMYLADLKAGAMLGRTIQPNYLRAFADGAPKGVMCGVLIAFIDSWRKSEWRGEQGGARSWTRLRWLLFVPRGIQWLGISRMAVALFAALSIGLGAWMFRFGVTPTGSRSGSVYIVDRWTGQTYLCEPAGCRRILLGGGQIAESEKQSSSIQPIASNPFDEFDSIPPAAQAEQQPAPNTAQHWHFVPVEGNPFSPKSPSHRQTDDAVAPPWIIYSHSPHASGHPDDKSALPDDWVTIKPAPGQQSTTIAQSQPVPASTAALPPGFVLDPPPQPDTQPENPFAKFGYVSQPQQHVPVGRLPTAPVANDSNQTKPAKSAEATNWWKNAPIVLPQLLPSGAPSTSAQSDQMWVQVPAREFLVTAPSKQKFIVNAPAGAEKYFVINIAKDEIGKLPAAARASLLPIEAGTTYDDWIVRPLHP